MILITGATEHFGKATIDHLLKKGIPAHTIAALVRDEAKATELKAKGIQIRLGDYNNYASLQSAFAGIEKLLLVSSSDLQDRLKQQENAVKAAREARVKHIIYTSFARKNETDSSPIASVGKAHLETERLIKASGIPYTLLLNSLYTDMLPIFFGEQVLQTGILPWPHLYMITHPVLVAITPAPIFISLALPGYLLTSHSSVFQRSIFLNYVQAMVPPVTPNLATMLH